MSGTRLAPRPGLGVPMGVSAALHALLVLSLIVVHAPAPRAMPPMYKVDLVAAPAAPRAAGVVTPTPPPPVARPAPPPPRAATPPRAMPMPTKEPPRVAPPPATPSPPTAVQPPPTPAPAPQAGGGPVGDRGTDVASVRTEGTEFPFPGYLDNIVRQIAQRFEPPKGAPRHAEVSFLIHRDGKVTNIEFITRSGLFAFDQEAEGAIDAAAHVNAFGPLPDGFADDVLPVVFSFDPRTLH